MAAQNGSQSSLRVRHQPSDRPSPQTAGKVLQPYVVVELAGHIVDRRYIAYAYGCSGTELAGKLSGEEVGGSKRTGPGGVVSLEFRDLRIVDRGTHTILVTVLEESPTGSGYDECAQVYTDTITVS